MNIDNSKKPFIRKIKLTIPFKQERGLINYRALILPLQLHSFLAGILSSVTSLRVIFQNFSFYLTWTAPFTLSITHSDTEITYCVDVYILESSTNLAHSQCEIHSIAFTYILSAVSTGCSNYMFKVTPINRLGNGTESTIAYQWMYARTYAHTCLTSLLFV